MIRVEFTPLLQKSRSRWPGLGRPLGCDGAQVRVWAVLLLWICCLLDRSRVPAPLILPRDLWRNGNGKVSVVVSSGE